jgi:hypothetical protein
VADNVFSSPDQKTPRSQRPDHQSGAQLGQFRPTAEQTEQSILKRVTVAVEKRSNHIYISLPMNNQSQVEFHFFFSDRAWWSRPEVREGKTTNTYAAMPLGGRGKRVNHVCRGRKQNVFVLCYCFRF